MGEVTFRSGDTWQVVPGHVVTLCLERRWVWRDAAYASGSIQDPRIDVSRIGLVPLPLQDHGPIDLRSVTEPVRSPEPYGPAQE